MNDLDHSLERTVLIRASRDTVFRYFTDSDRFAAWWGAGSHIDPRPGGALHIRYPNGAVASGQVLEVVEGRRVVFTYGYEDPGKPIPPGGSRVTVTLEDRPQGTLLHLRHDVHGEATRDAHVQGWRYQLAVFANVAAQRPGLDVAVDGFLAAWSEPDPVRRRSLLEPLLTDDVSFGDAFSCTAGLDDLVAHLGAAQLHMPGVRLTRSGDVRQCQGLVLADWVAQGPDDAPRGKGTNVLELAPDGRIARVVGFWAR